MNAQDKIEVKLSAVGYYRTVRNMQRNRGDENKAAAAQHEIDRLNLEISQLRKELAA